MALCQKRICIPIFVVFDMEFFFSANELGSYMHITLKFVTAKSETSVSNAIL